MKMVALAYGFIWLAVLAYVVIVAGRLGRLRGEMDELQRRIDRLKGSGG
jgi:CcmD family protein